MAVTLAQAQKLTQDKLCKCIIDEFRKDHLFEQMVFDDCVALNGGSTLNYVYNRIKTQGTADFREINTEYIPQEADTETITVALKIFGGTFQIDRVIQNDVKGITNQLSFQTEQKIKATKALFADTFINGDSAVKSNSFDGIDKAVTGSSTEHVPSAAVELSTSANMTTNGNILLDELDKIIGDMDGTPSGIYMNSYLKAIFNGLARRSGYFSTSDVDAFGKPVTKYQGVPLIALGDKPGTASPIIPISETGETSLYAVRIGLDGTHAVTPSGSGIINIYLPDFKGSKAVSEGGVEMVAASAIKTTRSIAALRKIKIK